MVGGGVTQPSHIAVAGLQVPAALATKIIEAVRWDQPHLPEGTGDNAAVRIWLKRQIADLMNRRVVAQGLEQAEQAVETTREFYHTETEQKRAEVQAAVETITEQ